MTNLWSLHNCLAEQKIPEQVREESFPVPNATVTAVEGDDWAAF